MICVYAGDYRALEGAISHAIDESKSHTAIVRLIVPARSFADACRRMDEECEGSADTYDGMHETWGKDLDGTEWRVHVRREE